MIGGALCLDFTNTVSSTKSGLRDGDKLSSFGDFVEWSRQAGLIDSEEAAELLAQWKADHEKGDSTLRAAVELRETIYRLFSAVAVGKEIAHDDLDDLNRGLSAAMAHLQVETEGEGFRWGWRGESNRMESLLWPIAKSAGELLVDGNLQRVRECAGQTCAWLFVDTSRNHSRRWCDMSGCGNRAKVRKHYHAHAIAAAKYSTAK
ncbi:MAG: ABATE domain-containing protein [Chloroflexota bacterium]|nr:ABATE domain-containing protein [Chloroflexota bacterium]